MNATAPATEPDCPISAGTETRRIINLDLWQVHETPENWTIYRQPDASDQAWLDLCASVAAKGITSPLEISQDFYIISGHRRYRAAAACERWQLPCIVDASIRMADLSPEERIALLAEPNKGIRIKTDSELYLEAAAAVDPDQAIRDAQSRKAAIFTKVKKSGLDEVETVGDIRRTDPSGERAAMLKAVLEILEAKRADGYLPTSGRHVHYNLLAKQVRTSPRRNGYIYGTSTRFCRATLQTADRRSIRRTDRPQRY
ncbi:MAG: ParB N-terminal domain-containing protein [Verrucomicrobiota bacterium]